MFQDLRQAVRVLARERGFAAAVILSLAVGIGANTAIFSVIDGVLLRPLPLRAPDRLITISEVIPKVAHLYPRLPVNLNHGFTWRERCSTLESVAMMRPRSFALTGAGQPELLKAASISANTFQVLGVELQAGRAFTDREERSGEDHVAIISDSLWNRRFHRDRSLIGNTIQLGGSAYVVTGVLPASFRFPKHADIAVMAIAENTDVFKPLGYDDEERQKTMGNHNLLAIGRMRAGVTIPQVLAEVNVVQASISKTLPEPMDLHASILPLQEQVVGGSRQGLLVVMGAVGMALLVLCVNLANLSFARAAGRARDFAIRAALGASRGQLIRQMLTESLILSLIGGALGVAVAAGGLDLLLSSAPVDLPRLGEVRLDMTALLFALAVSVGCGLVFGILPAFRTARQQPQEALKSGSHTTTEGGRGVRVRDVLVAMEVGLSAALLIAAGLLLHSFARLMNVEKGFSVEHVITAEVTLPSAKYEKDADRAAFFRNVSQKADALPGALAAGITSLLPFQGETEIDLFGTEHDTRPMLERPAANIRFISPGYFNVLAMPLRAGRVFNDGDRGRKVVVISQGLAERLWPGQDAVGRRVSRSEEALDVVGVAPDVRAANLDKDPVLTAYVPYWQSPQRSSAILVRTAMEPTALAEALRNAVWSVDPEVPVPETRTMEQVMSESVAQRRFLMTLVITFAAAALALAGFGIYGVLAYTITRRRTEIGIRMALGAGGSQVRRMVALEGMRPVVVGLALGIAGALALGRVLTTLLFDVSAQDPATITLVAFVIGAVSLVACLVPAFRASRLDPIRVLRSE